MYVIKTVLYFFLYRQGIMCYSQLDREKLPVSYIQKSTLNSDNFFPYLSAPPLRTGKIDHVQAVQKSWLFCGFIVYNFELLN